MSAAPWDTTLWSRACTGAPGALADLADRLLPRVRRLVFRLQGFRGDVDDTTQEVFVRLIEALPRLQDPRRAQGFVTGIATHVVRERWRRQPEETGATEPAVDEEQPLRQAAAGEESERIQAAVRALPESLRTVLVLCVYEQMTPAEAADSLKMSAGSVRHRLFRARGLLRQALDPSAAPEQSP